MAGGMAKYSRMLCELFYKLKDYPDVAAGQWLSSLLCNDELEMETLVELPVTTSTKNKSDTRVSLEEPDESAGLL